MLRIRWLSILPSPVPNDMLSFVISKWRSAYVGSEVFQTPIKSTGTLVFFGDWHEQNTVRMANAHTIRFDLIDLGPKCEFTRRMICSAVDNKRQNGGGAGFLREMFVRTSQTALILAIRAGKCQCLRMSSMSAGGEPL